MSGHTLDTLKNDPQTGQRNQQPRFSLLLGLQGKVRVKYTHLSHTLLKRQISQIYVSKNLCLVCQNDIPVFSPALTDGSLGDMIYFHSYKNPGLVLDIVEGKFFRIGYKSMSYNAVVI